MSDPRLRPSMIDLPKVVLKRIQFFILRAISLTGDLVRRFRPARLQRSGAIALLVATAILTGNLVSAQVQPAEPPDPLASLKKVEIPKPDNLKDFIKDEKKAIKLGKTLFWDMQVGSDGIMACATCHFHAGADSRSKNQLSPGFDGMVGKGLNYQLMAGDFPFHKLSDPDNRFSSVLSDTNDITGSQGIFRSTFNSITPGSATENTTVVPDPVFNVNGTNVRQVTGRNSPSVINAVFNFRNFWDGRAQNIFNGVNPFGLRDPNAKVFKAPKKDTLQAVKIQLRNASLASQAVGPPLSVVETSGAGRTFPDISQKLTQDIATTSKKMRSLPPLAQQLVSSEDSVLGDVSNSDSKNLRPGLKKTYEQLIQESFKEEWWDSGVLINVDANGNLTFTSDKVPKNPPDLSQGYVPIIPPNELETNQYTLMDWNFPLFLGLSIQAYESTLVSNDAPIDRYFDNKSKPGILSDSQIRGKTLFEGKAKCIQCHEGPLFTDAAIANVKDERLEHMIMGDGNPAVYDHGFYNIGVRPTGEDLGVGGKDPFGNPLAESRVAQQGKFQQLLGENPNFTVAPGERITANGAFKTPSLRNVELTAPYFHNGGKLTLEQVVEFYNRGGDFHEQNFADLDPNIQNLGLNTQDKADLVAFLKSFTDERVRYQQEPFDHPQLLIPNGHPGDTKSVALAGNGTAKDQFLEIPAVGKKGGAALPNFLAK
jgi:cytochrome c peroxidase